MLLGARAGNTQGRRTTREAEQSRSEARIQQETPPQHSAAPQPTAAQSQAGSPWPEARFHLTAQLAQFDLQTWGGGGMLGTQARDQKRPPGRPELRVGTLTIWHMGWGERSGGRQALV